MIRKLKLTGYITLLFMAIAGCSKDPEPVPLRDRLGPPPPRSPYQEIFWGKKWQKITGGYEIKVQSTSLTDSVINKGISVFVALITDWTPFYQVPSTMSDISLPDTVNVTYTATRGQLQLFAKAPFEMNFESDVMFRHP